MALTKSKSTIVASASNTAGSTTRGTLTLATVYGGIITMKITNGATGPTLQCEGRVLVSHEDSLPSAASAGADWKTVWRFGGGIANSAVTEQSFSFGPEVRHVEVEFTGNTGQAVTVEAIATTFVV
jgi:hypothetical protein